jgi:hypothetical protein
MDAIPARAAMAGIFLAVLIICLPAFASGQDPETLQVAVPPDMGCSEGPRAAQWQGVKKRFRQLFEGANGPFRHVDMEVLVTSVKDSIAEIEAVKGFSPEATNECGFGKLFMQLLSIATMEDPTTIAQYFQEHPDASSPVMTMLLDIPWLATAQSGWPFMAILGQISHQKSDVLGPVLNVDAVDGLANEQIKAYFNDLVEAQKQGDMIGMAHSSREFLRMDHQGSPFGTMTALAASAALSMNLQERLKGLELLQDSFRQAISNPQELDIALTIRWPLWAFLHVTVDVFAAD